METNEPIEEENQKIYDADFPIVNNLDDSDEKETNNP